MGNEFLSIKNIARQALPRLIENLVFPNLIYKDYSEAYEVGKGATVQVRKPVILTASDFDASTGVSAQDVKEESVEVTLDKLATGDVEFGAIARATSVDDLNRLFIEPAAAALAEKINGDGLGLYKDVPNYVGTAGNTPNSLAIFANAAKVLDDNKAPTTMRHGVWNPTCMAAFRQIGDGLQVRNVLVGLFKPDLLFLERHLGLAVFLKVELRVLRGGVADVQRDGERLVIIIVGDRHLGVPGPEGVQVGGEEFSVQAESLPVLCFFQILQDALLLKTRLFQCRIDCLCDICGALTDAVGGVAVRVVPRSCVAGGIKPAAFVPSLVLENGKDVKIRRCPVFFHIDAGGGAA